jgi:divalent metal cation (Fe/Co/Zn/Cd) transporter
MEDVESSQQKFDRLRRMRNATMANLGSALVSTALLPFSGSRILSGEAGHSGADVLAHGLRYGAERLGIDQETKMFRAFISASLLVPAGFLLWNAWKSGLDLVNGVPENRDPVALTANGVGALAIAGLNAYAYQQTRHIEEQSRASQATHNHAFADAFVSAGFAGSLVLEIGGVPNASSVGGLVFSALASGHLVHEAVTQHSHEHDHHHHHHNHQE